MTDKITMNLPPALRSDLDEAREATGENLTDSIHKAIRLYVAHLRNQAAGGHTEFVGPDDTRTRLMIL